MAEATDTSNAPKIPARKAATTRKSPTTRKTAASKADEASFAESIDLAKAAVTSATAAARARVKGAADTARTKAKSRAQSTATDWKAQGTEVKAQATKMARDAADTAKVRTGSAMHGLAKLITDTAQTVDTKLGPQYGDYARQAANAVANAADSLDEKDVEQLLGEARDFVRKSPAVAIGAAAIAGYVLMRLAKGSSNKS